MRWWKPSPTSSCCRANPDLRYNWAVVRLAAIDAEEMRGLVIDAWAMVVPKKVSAPYAELT